ncbi:unnamed protein product [Dibothriocephalus latus]|uniref:Uncharacterized protein n=1 Tax=Dibothriocephalus latus TaxID=60516 RepID=A0A3P7LJY5_DIBLA|nr:unnamed protein product [Dibothriocephalus latus]
MEKALSEYISRLRELTSELRGLRRAVADFKKKCDIAKTVGTSVSTVGTGLAIAGAIFAIPTGGLSLFVTGAAIGTTVAGVATNSVTDAINISETKEFLEKAEAIAEKAKAASDNFASHLEKLHFEYEKYKSQGISQDEAALRAMLKIYGRVGAVDKIREAEILRGEFNDFERASQEAAEEERRQSQNSRKTQSRPAENNKDGADGEDPNRTPNHRTCENRSSEAEAEELIKRLRELVKEIQGLTEDERKSSERLQALLKRFIKILQEMYEAGFTASINPKTRNLRLSITVNGRVIFIDISRDGFHLCDLDPSNMGNIFSRVPFGKSSEHTSCNVAVAVYYIRALKNNNLGVCSVISVGHKENKLQEQAITSVSSPDGYSTCYIISFYVVGLCIDIQSLKI